MRGVRLRTSVLLALAGWLAFTEPAVATSSDWSRNDHVEMRLISAVRGIGDRDMLPLGLQFRMKPGWKLYWRSPGDAGFPPRPNWEGSDNIAEIKMDWPAPTRFSIFDLETLGYVDEVILPLTVKLGQPGEPVTVKASVDYLTCKDICIPYPWRQAKPCPLNCRTTSTDIGPGFLDRTVVMALKLRKFKSRPRARRLICRL